jgi:hypothetical protein
LLFRMSRFGILFDFPMHTGLSTVDSNFSMNPE